MKPTPKYLMYALWAGSAALLLVAIFSKRGMMDWQRIERQADQLEAKILEAKRTRDALHLQVESLQKDPRSQERNVRQSLGYVRAEDIVIEFP